MNKSNPQEIPQLRVKEPEAARYSCVAPITLRTLRMRGKGPAYLKIGRAVVYDIRDLDKWLESKRVGN